MNPRAIKNLRNALRMSQKEFGQAIGGVSIKQVRRYEQGESDFPEYRVQYILKLQKKLAV